MSLKVISKTPAMQITDSHKDLQCVYGCSRAIIPEDWGVYEHFV